VGFRGLDWRTKPPEKRIGSTGSLEEPCDAARRLYSKARILLGGKERENSTERPLSKNKNPTNKI